MSVNHGGSTPAHPPQGRVVRVAPMKPVPLTADEETDFRAVAQVMTNAEVAAMVPSLLATLDALRDREPVAPVCICPYFDGEPHHHDEQCPRHGSTPDPAADPDELYPGANAERARLHQRQAAFDAEMAANVTLQRSGPPAETPVDQEEPES